MPLLAFATTRFLLLPKLARGLAQQPAPAAAPASSTEGGSAAKSEGKASADKKVSVSMNKMLVNVAGTMGTRYLMTSITLVGNTPDFAAKINDNMDQLKDLATGTLSSKTISDLEKPGARNVDTRRADDCFQQRPGRPGGAGNLYHRNGHSIADRHEFRQPHDRARRAAGLPC